MTFFPLLSVLLVAFVGFPAAARAYVDPGTTGSVFSVVAAALSGAGLLGAFLIRPIKRLFTRKKQRPGVTEQRAVHPETEPKE